MFHPGNQHRIGRRALIAVSGLLAAPAIVRAQGKTNGVALVIGNSKYKWEASLPNVTRDGPDVARRFQALGLKTEYLQNLDRSAMRSAIEGFTAAARQGEFAAFYFAGHGVTMKNGLFLVPVDADLSEPENTKTLVGMGAIREPMKQVPHSMLVFDVCRNSPADGWKQVEAEQSAGVTPSEQASWIPKIPNMLMLYSTARGRIALDGPAGQNSPFARAFLQQFSQASLDVRELPAKLRRDLLLTTGGRQLLVDLNTYTQPYRVSTGGAPAGPGLDAGPAQPVELDRTYAYAAEADLPLPPGLVALRAPGKSVDSQKIGAFKFETRGPTGWLFLWLIVVLSVDDKGTANVVLSSKQPTTRWWSLVTATTSGNNLSFVPFAGAGTYTFDWRDANSGSVGVLHPTNRPYASRFARLDG